MRGSAKMTACTKPILQGVRACVTLSNASLSASLWQVRNVGITVRTILIGLVYLATFIFGANALGIFGASHKPEGHTCRDSCCSSGLHKCLEHACRAPACGSAA